MQRIGIQTSPSQTKQWRCLNSILWIYMYNVSVDIYWAGQASYLDQCLTDSRYNAQSEIASIIAGSVIPSLSYAMQPQKRFVCNMILYTRNRLSISVLTHITHMNCIFSSNLA